MAWDTAQRPLASVAPLPPFQTISALTFAGNHYSTWPEIATYKLTHDGAECNCSVRPSMVGPPIGHYSKDFER